MSASDSSQPPITRLLNDMAARGEDASEQLLEHVYEQLRSLAAAKVARLSAGESMRATELVHEAWLCLEKDLPNHWDGRAHFFGAAARAMRRILVDQYRHRNRQKRGGGQHHEALSSGIEVPSGLAAIDLLALDEALDQLEMSFPRPSRIVMLRYFAGASVDEIAKMLGISPRTVERDWEFARTWLRRALS